MGQGLKGFLLFFWCFFVSWLVLDGWLVERSERSLLAPAAAALCLLSLSVCLCRAFEASSCRLAWEGFLFAHA